MRRVAGSAGVRTSFAVPPGRRRYKIGRVARQRCTRLPRLGDCATGRRKRVLLIRPWRRHNVRFDRVTIVIERWGYGSAVGLLLLGVAEATDKGDGLAEEVFRRLGRS